MNPDRPILVSACLAAVCCRYDGKSKALPTLSEQAKGYLPLCPEVAGGLSVPREPASITGGDGFDVLDGKARVVTASGRDVTAEFVAGAHAVLALAKESGVSEAVLKQNSPSCGVGSLRTAQGKVMAGYGVAAALLRRNGIQVVSDEEWTSKIR